MDKFTKTYLSIILQEYDQQPYEESYWVGNCKVTKTEKQYDGLLDISYDFDASNLLQFDNKQIIFEVNIFDIKYDIDGILAEQWQGGSLFSRQLRLNDDSASFDFKQCKDEDINIICNENLTDQEKQKYINIFKSKYILDKNSFYLNTDDVQDDGYDSLDGIQFGINIKQNNKLFAFKDRYKILYL